MSCERPGIVPIDDSCCFSCYLKGRGSYDGPVAIVLHEVDHHLEALNNKLENCCSDEHDVCHQSFHYGVGGDGRIINWVDPDDTAWAFDPLNSDVDCGICGWSIATQEGTSVDPNLYTINIAVSTGVVAFNTNSPSSLSENIYGQRQYSALVRLVGWLAGEYGIAINQNTIWRHCNELNDFPGVCDDCFTYAKFLEDIQDCIDTPDYSCDYQCNCLQNAQPTTQTSCDLASWVGAGCVEDCDCDCDQCVCGCAEVTSVDFCSSEDPTTMTVTGLPFETCLVDGDQGVNIRLDEDQQSNTVVLDFPAEQSNLELCFGAFGNSTDEQIIFTPAPDSVDGDLALNGAVVTSNSDGGSGCVYWAGPVASVTFVYDTTDLIVEDEEHNVCLNQMRSDECYCEQPAIMQPGDLIQGCDCLCYTFPDISGQVDFCNLMQGAVSPATEVAVPGQTMLLARDCDSYYLPDLCEQIAALPVAPLPDQLVLVGYDDQQDCQITPVTTECDPSAFTNAPLGLSQDGATLGFYRPRPSLPTRTAVNGESLIPTTDGVVYLDAENGPVIFTLTAPGPCDPTEYWIKRKDCNTGNTVTINGGANTIDTLPAIQLDTPGPYGGCGEAVHLHWDGANWSIL